MRFDAYAASIRDFDHVEVAQILARETGGMVARGKPTKRHGDTMLNIDLGPRTGAFVGWDKGNGIVSVEAKGEDTPAFVDVIRAAWPGHAVSRVDSCEDYRGGRETFDRLQALIRLAVDSKRSRGNRVELGWKALPDNPEKGRTWGNLARGGAAYCRLYESGLHPDRQHYPPDAIRLEAEFRPQVAKAKRAAATMSPSEVWGLSSWTSRVHETVLGCPVERFTVPQDPRTLERRFWYLATRFERTFRDLLADYGDWECVGRVIEDAWEQNKRLRINRGDLKSE